MLDKVKIIKIDSDLVIMCDKCNYKVRSYDSDPMWPYADKINNKKIDSVNELYPNYCENCGSKLK